MPLVGDTDRVVAFNGISGVDGQYLVPPQSLDAFVPRVKAAITKPTPDVEQYTIARTQESYGPPSDLSYDNLDEVGWAVVFADAVPANVRDALRPLLDLRKQQAGKLYREMTVTKETSGVQWMKSLKIAFGGMNPNVLPLHVMLVGDAERIPFAFQHTLDLEYSTGRIPFSFDDPKAFAAYAKAVVDWEGGTTPARTKQCALFAPRHTGDRATALSSTELVPSTRERRRRTRLGRRQARLQREDVRRRRRDEGEPYQCAVEGRRASGGLVHRRSRYGFSRRRSPAVRPAGRAADARLDRPRQDLIRALFCCHRRARDERRPGRSIRVSVRVLRWRYTARR